MATAVKTHTVLWLTVLSVLAAPAIVHSSRLMVILLDGFRWDYFNIHGMGLKGFPKLFQIGTKVEYTVLDFPTLSYPNYYTIMTGLYDDIHGMVANYMYDEVREEEFLIGTNPEYNQSFWWDGGDPLWITATRQKKSAHMYYWPNCEVLIRGLTPASCVPYIGIPSRRNFIKATSEGMALLHKKRADVVGIYYELTDATGHRYGPRSAELKQVIRDLDEDIYGLLADWERRNLRDKVDIIIMSDHGMTDVSPERVVRIENYVNASDVQRFLEYGAFMSIWPKDGKLDEVYNSLVNASKHMSVYKREETPEHWHYRKHYRISPIVVSMETGWIVLKPNQTYKYYNESQPLSGTHGYDNTYTDMRGIFVAAGPNFKASFVSKPIHAVDMYQVMCKSLGIQPSAHNGSWSRVKEMWVGSAATHLELNHYLIFVWAVVVYIYLYM
ncbi:glycerophosphocholine cholinephosphodiesterase ENPP6-like [Liolophura sinensis]|uniref:glycerophosphocholine cholinephosphodiesterase ENPP6-like n=1 Tax=Liolophura sinensis TaxID=3198878 RepID=UPI003157FC66